MSKHKEFFLKLFNEFEDNNIVYFVIKNYESLPESSTRDVDIWVKKEDHKRALRILFSVAESLGWKLIKKSLRMGFYKGGEYYFLNKKEIIVVDISPFLHWKGISYLDEEIFERYIRKHNKGFNIPTPGIEAAALIFRGAMMGEIKEEYKTKIIKCVNEDPTSFLEVLERPFGKEISLQILNLVKENKWKELEENINSLHFIIFKRAIFHRLLFQIRQWIFYYCERIKSHFQPRGSLFIVFIGPDGSGKTTCAKELMESEVIKRLFCRRVYLYRRFYIPWFKKLALIFKKKRMLNVDAVKNDKGDIIPLSTFKAVLYIFYLGIEFFIGHYYIRRQKSNSALILFDRYFYDYMVFKDFENCPRWIFKVFLKIIPKPDLIIYLKSTTEIIYSRKPEHSIHELNRQVRLYDNFKKYFSNIVEIDTSKEIENSIFEIQNIIIKKLLQQKT